MTVSSSLTARDSPDAYPESESIQIPLQNEQWIERSGPFEFDNFILGCFLESLEQIVSV